jgi:hypothetical protein
MSTDQTHEEQLDTGQHGFGRHHDDDDVLEGQLIEPEAGFREDPAVTAADDPDRPVDDPIVMDTAPVDPEDDRVVLDSRDDTPDAVTSYPASPAAAGFENRDGFDERDGSYGSDSATTTNSAIPMPGGPAAGDVTPAETTMDDGTLDGTAPVTDTTSVTGTPAATAATPAGVPVLTAETSGTTGESVPSNDSATADRVASIEQWHEIKAMFVDDPRAATQRAASLVDGSVEALLASIKQEQQSMQADWQGDGADTEKLRTALQHYRKFWTRLEEFSHQA